MVFGRSLTVKIAIASAGIALPAKTAREKTLKAKTADNASPGICRIDIVRITRHKYGREGEASEFRGVEADSAVDEAVCTRAEAVRAAGHGAARAVGLQGGVGKWIDRHAAREVLERGLYATKFDITPLIAGKPNPLLTWSSGRASTGVQAELQAGVGFQST